MGHGIAQVFAVAGHDVWIYDERADILASVPMRVRANLERLGADPTPAGAIRLADSLQEAVGHATFVTEAVAEDLEVKQELFRQLDELAPPDAVLATNTSVMSITAIAERARDRGRIVGTHWWNPPHLVPLVEVTPGDSTEPETVDRTVDLISSVGKTAVRVKRDVPGFIGNRMQHALWREAIAIVDAGIADAEDVDRVVKASFGLRLSVLGPIENADLIGLDLTQAIHEYILPHLDARPSPAPLLGELVERGDLGMKAGRGLRDWTPTTAEETRNRLFDHLVTATRAQ